MQKWDREALTHEEINRCIENCETLEERVVIIILADTGERKNELLSMRKDWIRFDRGKYGQMTIPIRGDYKPIPPAQRKTAPGEKFKPRGPKTKKARRIAITRRMSEALKEFFDSNDRVKMTPHQIWRLCVRVGKDAGIEKRLTPHIFRHSWITNSFKAGVDTKRIAKKVGHVDSHMVESIYLHLDDDETDAELERGGMLDV